MLVRRYLRDYVYDKETTDLYILFEIYILMDATKQT